jgi:hypothetical protein
MNERPDNLHRSIEAAKSLRLELARMIGGTDAEMSSDDLQTLQDSFDGETTLDVEIRNAVLAIEEDEIFVRGIKARETELKDRRLRLEKRIEATRGLIEQAMTVAQWPKHEMDIGSVTLGKAKPRLEIDQESEIPSQFWKRKDPDLDKAGLLKVLNERQKAMEAVNAIKDEEDRATARLRVNVELPPVPGCHLEAGGHVLTIRRS